jgi:hypothetical protein
MSEIAQINSIAPVAPVKPGYKTSEFWLTLATAAAAILNRKLGLDISPEVLLTVAGTVGAYAISRMGTKRAAITSVVVPISPAVQPPPVPTKS